MSRGHLNADADIQCSGTITCLKCGLPKPALAFPVECGRIRRQCRECLSPKRKESAAKSRERRGIRPKNYHDGGF